MIMMSAAAPCQYFGFCTSKFNHVIKAVIILLNNIEFRRNRLCTSFFQLLGRGASSNMASLVRTSVGKIQPGTSVLMVCDIQERFKSIIHKWNNMVSVSKTMVDAANTMSIPVVVTEQYPKAFLHTVDTLQASFEKSTKVFEKKKFSMVTEECKTHLSTLGEVKSAIIVGVEAHVCVLQTSLDLIELGYDVHVLADGVSSQNSFHYECALDRLKQSGAFITTSESILFQLCGTSEHEHFRSISKLVKDQAAALK